MIPYSRQHIDEEDIKAVVEALKSDWITQGPKIAEFEKKVADYCGAKYTVAVSSGTAALHLACLAADVSEGDEVITSPITFVASANCALYVDAKPVFADIRADTYCINPAEIEKRITKKTKAIIPVDFAGHPCDMDEINKIAENRGLIVIEDAAHSLGAEYKGKRVGSLADMTIFSFHPVKHITTGEGGAVLTNHKDLHEKLLIFRNHGITKDDSRFKIQDSRLIGDWYYEMHYLGHNYRMTDIQAALGISQLKKLDSFVERRRGIADIYNRAFRGNPHFDIPYEESYAYSSYHLYPIRLKGEYKDKKREIFSALRKEGLGVQVHYIPVYWQPYYKDLGYSRGLCPVAEDFYQRELSIPIYPAMKDEDIKYVIEKIKQVFNELVV